MSDKPWCLFDVAGVLVEINWHQQMALILAEELTSAEIHQRWAASESVVEFECGRLDFIDFLHRFSKENALTLSIEALEKHFLAMIVGEFEDSFALLAEVSKRYQIALLSNSNTAFWPIIEQFSFIKQVDRLFLSHQMGCMKPDITFFNQVISELAVEPKELLFFDDGKSNVEAAKSLGINAYQVDHPRSIYPYL